TQQTKRDLGDNYREASSAPVVRKMVEELKRPGKRFGAGFYDYPTDSRKRLWSGLREHFPLANPTPNVDEIRSRLLVIQALETARCLEEGVLTDPADGDIGSILGWGFPPWTGGTLSYIDTVGIKAFVAECERLTDHHGARFAPSAWLKARAAAGQSFY
ncbi:MAG: 3-hydroxyacyl-CoA dehydrogenase, partial [Gammaproteobacteria bacterium]